MAGQVEMKVTRSVLEQTVFFHSIFLELEHGEK
jgi:hypothetical protein